MQYILVLKHFTISNFHNLDSILLVTVLYIIPEQGG
jgi:hypothetical protein